MGRAARASLFFTYTLELERRFLLDTTVLVDASKQREPARTWLELVLRQRNEVGVCSVTVAEFFAGILPADRPRWEAFVNELTFWGSTGAIAKQAGIYRFDFARRGKTIQTPDALIAATAVAAGATLVTDNAKDYPMPEIMTLQLRAVGP